MLLLLFVLQQTSAHIYVETKLSTMTHSMHLHPLPCIFFLRSNIVYYDDDDDDDDVSIDNHSSHCHCWPLIAVDNERRECFRACQ